jgi:hypothetical protein
MNTKHRIIGINRKSPIRIKRTGHGIDPRLNTSICTTIIMIKAIEVLNEVVEWKYYSPHIFHLK